MSLARLWCKVVSCIDAASECLSSPLWSLRLLHRRGLGVSKFSPVVPLDSCIDVVSECLSPLLWSSLLCSDSEVHLSSPSLHFLFLFCVDGMHVCIHVDMHKYGHTCVWKWKPEDDSRYLPQSSHPPLDIKLSFLLLLLNFNLIFFETRSL